MLLPELLANMAQGCIWSNDLEISSPWFTLLAIAVWARGYHTLRFWRRR